VQSYSMALVGLGLLLQTTSASAWWQWYQFGNPFGPPPAMWFYQNTPMGPATEGAPGFWFYQGFPTWGVPGFWLSQRTPTVPGQIPSGFWHQQLVPSGAVSGWRFSGPISGLFVEQSQSPAGYSIRVHTGQQGAQDLDMRIEGGALIIRRHHAARAVRAPLQMQQAGWMTQLIALPADANVGAMRVAPRIDGIDIFIPSGG